MKERVKLELVDCVRPLAARLDDGGVLCTVVDESGAQNVLTLGWGQIGTGYRDNPVMTIAITPRRYSWRFLEEVPEFVIAVPDASLDDEVLFCGTRSGRDMDKFEATGLTPVSSVHVRAPSILECPYNLECRVYTRITPPHNLLTPEHRQRPLEEQHTIYFAEVLGIYGWKD
ncbi:MAG: flavin reductase family protein [Anaerolineae bacterium]